MKAESKQKGRSRWYGCPKCGDSHPSVTTILDVIGSQALMGWMAKNGTAKLNVLDAVSKELIGPPTALGRDLYQTIRDTAEARWKLTEDTAFWKSGRETGQEAADYGTQAHAWVESHLKGVQVDLAALPGPARNACNAYLEWSKQHELKTVETEKTFYNCKLNYAGTADWVGTLDGELSVGDWKTSTGIFFNYVIQGWGYALADETENASRLYRQIFIGRFGKDGTPEVRICKRNEFPSLDTARDILIACGHIFKAQQEWETRFPFIKKSKTKPEEVKA